MTSTEQCANYIFDNKKEQDDYREHCEENESRPYVLAPNKEPTHILEHAAHALVFEHAYDLEGWTILTSKQWDDLKGN